MNTIAGNYQTLIKKKMCSANTLCFFVLCTSVDSPHPHFGWWATHGLCHAAQGWHLLTKFLAYFEKVGQSQQRLKWWRHIPSIPSTPVCLQAWPTCKYAIVINYMTIHCLDYITNMVSILKTLTSCMLHKIRDLNQLQIEALSHITIAYYWLLLNYVIVLSI